MEGVDKEGMWRSRVFVVGEERPTSSVFLPVGGTKGRKRM